MATKRKSNLGAAIGAARKPAKSSYVPTNDYIAKPTGGGVRPPSGGIPAPVKQRSAPAISRPSTGGYSVGPVQRVNDYSSGPYINSSPGYDSAPAPAPAPAVAVPSEEDYLAGDSAYQTQFAALKAALERYQADQQLETSKYNTDYTTSLRDLGYDEGTKQWNWTDQLTAAGRAYQSQLNDFASRGMLQSQGYADANSDLQRLMNDQYGQMATNKTNFMTGMERALSNYKGENTSSQQAARAEAIARRAAQYGL